jgi:hypothetical protein
MILPRQAAFLVLLAVLVGPHAVVAQVTDQKLVNMMLDCAMHESGGPWVDADLRGDGWLRFNYLHESPKAKPNSGDDHFQYADNVYTAFWNAAQTKGDLLHFTVRRIKGMNGLTISNEGWISFSKEHLKFEIFQGGVWSHDHYLVRVKKLVRAPVQTVPVSDIKRTGTVCDSLTHPNLEKPSGSKEQERHD